MRTVIVSYKHNSYDDNEQSIKIPEADLTMLLIGLTHGGSIITNIALEVIDNDGME